MIQWVQNHGTILWWMAAVSVVTFVSTLVVVPMLVVKIPSDYFAHERRTMEMRVDGNAAARWGLMLAKNLLGYFLIVVGTIMLVLPGQGILTIVAGIMLLNFPGKFKLEKWIVSRRPVLRAINWTRRRAGKDPLVF